MPGRSSPTSPRNLLIDEAADAGAVLGIEQFEGAQQRGEDAAAVDVAYQDAGCVRGVGHPHVHDVVRPQIDFRRGAGALDDDEVVVGGEGSVAVEDGGKSSSTRPLW